MLYSRSLAISNAVSVPVGTFIGRAVGGPSAWSPLNLTGLEYWFDASDLSTVNDLGGITDQWNDKSGNDRHFVSTGAARPITGGTLINGLNTITVVYTTWMNTLTQLPVIAQPFHQFMVYKPVVLTGDHRIMNSLNNTDWTFIWARTNWSLFAGVLGEGTRPVTTNTTFISALFNGASSKIWVDSNLPDTVDAGTNNHAGLRTAGFATTGDGNQYAHIGEMIFCSEDNTTNIDAVKEYLATKWGLSL